MKKQLYNYIVNTYGISKDNILSLVESRIEQLLDKHLKSKLDSKSMEYMILERLTSIVQNGFEKRGYFHEKYLFETFLKSKIEEILIDRLQDEYVIDVKLVKKDAKLINKV